jgi:SPP1 gp7 family putative phage head morphogenesis protein
MINDDLAEAILIRELNINRFDADLRKRVSDELAKMDNEVLAKLKGDLTKWNRTDFNEKLKSVRKIIDDYYAEVADMTAKDLAGLSESEASFIQNTVNELVDEEIFQSISKKEADGISLKALIQGALLASWFAKLSADAYFRVSTQMRIGYGSGDKTVIDKVESQLKTNKSSTLTIVSNSIRTVASVAREEVYKKNYSVLKGKLYVAVLDNRTSLQCIAYDGSVYDMDNKPIGKESLPYRDLPAHFNCRSMYIPILKSFKEIGLPEIPKSTRSSMDGQVPEDMNFKDFLEKKGKAFQDEVLGKGKAQLWRDGKITLQQLLDQSGNPIPLKELDK